MPGRPPYENEVVKKWTAEIARSDGFISSRRNTTTALQRFLRTHSTGFIRSGTARRLPSLSYGGAAGARSVQQLREKAIELQLAPIRSSVHIPAATLWVHFQGGDVDAGLAELEAPAKTMIDDLLWWTGALKAARATAP
jgi:NAD(P)H-dependent FMN reductase